MRAAGVVVAGHPPIQASLDVLDRVERLLVGEEVPAQGLVEPLDLARSRRRSRLGQPVDDAVVPADPIEQHLPAPPEPGSELLAIVSEHFIRDPVALQLSLIHI